MTYYENGTHTLRHGDVVWGEVQLSYTVGTVGESPRLKFVRSTFPSSHIDVSSTLLLDTLDIVLT